MTKQIASLLHMPVKFLTERYFFQVLTSFFQTNHYYLNYQSIRTIPLYTSSGSLAF